MNVPVALALVALLQDPGSPETQGQTIEQMFGRKGEFMITGDAVVATIRKVSEPPATNGNPPRVEIEVHEVLLGDPKLDRSKAIWRPHSHDVDWVGAGAEERLAQWEAQPMELPKTGVKMILGGEVDPETKIFRISPVSRIPYSLEKRDGVLAEFKRHKEVDRKAREESARTRKAFEEARAKWRAKVSAKDIAGYVDAADFVGVGRIVTQGEGGVRTWTFEITEIVKGVRRRDFKDQRYFLEILTPEDLHPFVGDRKTACLLFLTEKGMTDGIAGAKRYARIPLGDGIVLADEESLQAARAAAVKK